MDLSSLYTYTWPCKKEFGSDTPTWVSPNNPGISNAGSNRVRVKWINMKAEPICWKEVSNGNHTHLYLVSNMIFMFYGWVVMFVFDSYLSLGNATFNIFFYRPTSRPIHLCLLFYLLIFLHEFLGALTKMGSFSLDMLLFWQICHIQLAASLAFIRHIYSVSDTKWLNYISVLYALYHIYKRLL